MEAIVNIRKSSFSLITAKNWWESPQDEFMIGHFNVSLYLQLIEFRMKNPNYEETAKPNN